jgi:hypothetical protein
MPAPQAPLPTTQADIPPDLCQERFEAAWRGRKPGESPPCWKEFLPPSGGPCTPDFVYLLLQTDIEFRVKAGLPALLAEPYFQHERLQADDARLDAAQQEKLIRWEYQQRWKRGERAARRAYLERFPGHAAALHDLGPRWNCPLCRQKGLRLEEDAESGHCPRCPARVPLADLFPPPRDRSGLDLRHYELLDRLDKEDKGGMGEVYLSRDPGLDRPVALKVLLPKWQGNRKMERRFEEEARITGSLQHPNIVPVYNLGRLPDGRLYFTMKVVRGSTFDRLLENQGGAERRAAHLGVFEQVCRAVAYAHSKGVIHRDLKPANIMVGRFGEVQVMDWGLAKVLDPAGGARPFPGGSAAAPESVIEPGRAPGEDTQVGAVMGTYSYMPPEQARGQTDRLDERCDVFSLGAILCKILTGLPPYAGDSEQVKGLALAGHLEPAQRRLEDCRADPELVGLAKECLCPEVDGRPRHAEAVAERVTGYLAAVQQRLHAAELERAADQARAKEQLRAAEAERAMAAARAEEVQARLVAETQARKAAEKARRRTLWGVALGGLFLMALLAAGFFAWRNHEARQKHLADTLDKALTAAMSGDLETAEKATAEAEAAGASPGQVHMLRGQIALHRGQSREAIRHLKEAVKDLSDNVAAWGMLAAAYADDGNWEHYDKAIQKMATLMPSTAEDFLFKGYAEANLKPDQGLRTIQQAFDRRPMMSIALLLRAEVRAMLAQDTDDLDEAEGAVQDAKYAKEMLHDNPTALWVSLEAHLAKAGVHEHRADLDQRRAEAELDQRRAELELAGKDAEALERFTALPEAVVYRWTYFREVGREDQVLDELRGASKDTDHVSVKFDCAMALYRRGTPDDFEEALRVLKNPRGEYSYSDRLLPFVLAELDYPNKQDWPARARKACEDFAKDSKDGAAIMDAQTVLCLLGKKDDAVKASKALLQRKELFYTLRSEPILRCVRYNADAPDMREDKLLQLAEGSRWDQCLAHYSIAMTKLAKGHRKEAKDHFDEAVKTRAWGWSEYDLSRVFLSRLKKDPNWPPWIQKGR